MIYKRQTETTTSTGEEVAVTQTIYIKSQMRGFWNILSPSIFNRQTKLYRTDLESDPNFEKRSHEPDWRRNWQLLLSSKFNSIVSCEAKSSSLWGNRIFSLIGFAIDVRGSIEGSEWVGEKWLFLILWVCCMRNRERLRTTVVIDQTKLVGKGQISMHVTEEIIAQDRKEWDRRISRCSKSKVQRT